MAAIVKNGDGYGDGYGYGDGSGYGSGYGYGYGYGYGSGYGDGYGYGYGDGDGSGYSSGYGYGDGSGYGSGYGYGYGSGYGDGDGSGYSSGYGYGDGSGYGKSFWETFCASAVQSTGHAVKDAIPAIWRSTATGQPANAGRTLPSTKPGDIHTAPGPLRDKCGEGQLHATHNPERWEGEKWWLVLMHEPVVVGDDKMWGLKRTIVCEI